MTKQYFLKVNFDLEERRFITNIIEYNGKDTGEKLCFFRKSLSCQTIDIVEYSNKVDLIIDDEGLLVSDNPVFEIPSGLYVSDLQIAGCFLVGKKRVSPHGNIETVGFDSPDEISLLTPRLRMKVIGVTN